MTHEKSKHIESYRVRAYEIGPRKIVSIAAVTKKAP